MPTKAQLTKLKRQNTYLADGTGAYTQVTRCKNFTYGLNKEVTDTTDLDDDWRDNETSLNSQQPVNFELFFEPGNAMHDEISGLLYDYMNDNLRFWELQPRTGKARRFEGKVTTCEEAYSIGEQVVMKVTITPRGPVTFVTAS